MSGISVAKTPTATPSTLTDLDRLVLRLGVTQLSRVRAASAEQALRTEVVTALRRGGSRAAVNPYTGEKIAQVTVSETAYKADVVDPSATTEWVKATYPAKTRKVVKVREGFTPEDVLRALEVLAPYMVEEVVEVEPWVLRELELKSQQAGTPMGWGGEVGENAPPGIKVVQPDSTVRVTFSPHAVDVVDGMLANRVIDMDGNIIADGGA